MIPLADDRLSFTFPEIARPLRAHVERQIGPILPEFLRPEERTALLAELESRWGFHQLDEQAQDRHRLRVLTLTADEIEPALRAAGLPDASFPALTIAFQRTLRIPDDGRTYPLTGSLRTNVCWRRTPAMPDEHHAALEAIQTNTPKACERLNEFTAKVFQTRVKKIGSGMGGVIEAVWGFFLNEILAESPTQNIELSWMYGHEYNDFACLRRGELWNPETGEGELLRVEVKSMLASADESKAHFDRLKAELNDTDLIAVFVWDWIPVTGDAGSTVVRVSPQVRDFFVGRALDVAELRNALHQERGGSFVVAGHCPDNCTATACKHVGEPLNASGKRERSSGPNAARVSAKVSYAANFGGLVRMLGCSSAQAKGKFSEICDANETAAKFAEFIQRNLRPQRETKATKKVVKASAGTPKRKKVK